MSTTYKPGALPDDPKELVRALRDEFSRLERALNARQAGADFQTLHISPTRTRGGMVVVADGSDWNPGSGFGLYLRNEANTQWSGLSQNIPYAPGSFTVSANYARMFVGFLTLNTGDTATIQGGARVLII